MVDNNECTEESSGEVSAGSTRDTEKPKRRYAKYELWINFGLLAIGIATLLATWNSIVTNTRARDFTNHIETQKLFADVSLRMGNTARAGLANEFQRASTEMIRLVETTLTLIDLEIVTGASEAMIEELYLVPSIEGNVAIWCARGGASPYSTIEDKGDIRQTLAFAARAGIKLECDG